MHVDTGHNFPEAIEFRDRRVAELGERLIVASVQDSIDKGRAVEETGPRASRNRLQTVTLLDAIAEHGFDAAFGGARRDEERARAKERIFSFRDDFGQWDPRRQRAELWRSTTAACAAASTCACSRSPTGPSSTCGSTSSPRAWRSRRSTRRTSARCSSATGCSTRCREFIERMDGEEPFTESVRYRTVGDMTCTGAVRSTATTLEDVVAEIAATRVTERGETRADDRVIGGRHGGPQARGLLLVIDRSRADRRAGVPGAPRSSRSCCASPPRAPSTTASRR